MPVPVHGPLPVRVHVPLYTSVLNSKGPTSQGPDVHFKRFCGILCTPVNYRVKSYGIPNPLFFMF